MNPYAIVLSAAFFTSLLTFFSGFGLGTLLMPVFAIFFPIEVAIALTAIVHFLNNAFKFVLVGKFVKLNVIIKFGIPAVIFAFLGAKTLIWLSHLEPIFQYGWRGRQFLIMPEKLVISVLMIVFALLEILPKFKDLKFDSKYLPLGGILSGFFGGISGHQGALRSAFLVRSGLSKESYIATGIAIACIVDLSRLFVYFSYFQKTDIQNNFNLILFATLSAFMGSWIGSRFIHKITVYTIQILVSILLFVIALGLAAGLI